MKFYIKWIKKYINKNINIKKIKNELNNNGFETKYEFIPQNYIKTKILKINKKKKNIYIIKINIKNKFFILKIKSKKKLNNNKYIWINKNINNIKKKNILHIKIQKNIKNKDIILIYQNKQTNKQIKFLKINIPYNRIDCNNIYNISKEICNITKNKFIDNKINIKIKNNKKINFKIIIKNKIKKYFINYKYIIIKNKKNYIYTPDFIKKKLENMGFLIENNILDIINYIAIEFGSIIICLDFNKIKNKKIYLNIEKKKNKNENIIILKTKKQYLNKNYFIYNKKFIFNKNTSKIILISILLNKKFINKNYKNNINNISIFNNNIDKNIQYKSIKNICYIINNILNSKIIYFKNKKKKEINKKIKLKYSEIKKKIGIYIKKKKIINILKKIKCKIIIKKKFILILKHKIRHDLNIKEDIIEEIIKFYNYKKIKYKKIKNILKINKTNKLNKNIKKIKILLSNLGYTEVINFHFSNKKKENIFFNKKKYIKIKNPILKKMSILRTSLIPKLIDNIKYNTKFKNNNIKLFEIGNCYKIKNNKINIIKKISFIIYGLKYKRNWNTKNKKFNFFDIKNDLELLLKKQNKIKNFYIKKSKKKFLDKIQNANIYINKKKIGIIGMINEKIQKTLSIKYPIFITELKINNIIYKSKKKIKKISKFQYYERDITLIIDENISLYKIINKCKIINQIKKINIIDIYINKKLTKKKKKNITIKIIIEDNKKVLNEIEINKITNKCKSLLRNKFKALIDKDIKKYFI